MRKIKLLLLAVLSSMAWTGVMAQDKNDAEYQSALAAITDGATYRIKTTVNGTAYYVTTGGKLTSVKDNAGYFTITKTEGGYFGTGFRIDTGTNRFTNPPLSNDKANLKPGNFNNSTGDRTDWERQIFYLNEAGKYAIRSCNCADGTSSWNDAARTHWTYYIDGDVVTPCYSYEKAYNWEIEGPLTVVNVTYKVVEFDGTTEVSSTTVKQEANSAIISPLPGTGMEFNGFFHEKFYYDYAASGTIGDTDCTITITRTEKAGLIKDLSDLSNKKAYYIGCDRGAMIAYNGSMSSTALNDAAANALPYGKFALLNYDDNYYIFSVDENKFVKNDASVALDLTEVGFSKDDAIKLAPKTAPYFLLYFTKEGVDNGLNTNGNNPLGYVINTWMNADPGNLYYIVEAEDFEPSAALAELEAYFHPKNTATYIVKDEQGNVIFTSEPQPVKVGAKITTLLDEFKRPYYTYNDVDVTISELETNIEFTATWNGPFVISTDFANAHWYDMAVRGSYYVTTDNPKDDKSLAPVQANTMGLVEDSYQWAFVGNGYDGFKIFNKGVGSEQVYAWVSNDNASIPTFVDVASANAWVIKPSTSDISGAFMLTTDLGYQTNQYGGASGSLKIWASTDTGDAGSAFTVFDVPTNFAEYVTSEIAPTMDATGYFTFTDAAKAAIGYDESKKTECSFVDYKKMKETLTDDFKADINNYNLPETGYYILKNKSYGTYFGVDPTDACFYGNYKAATAAKHIVYLIKEGNQFAINLMGNYLPADVARSAQVKGSEKAALYTVIISSVGYAAFQSNPEDNFSCLHCAQGGSVVGWVASADASQWAVEDVEGFEYTIGAEGYATMYAPAPAIVPEESDVEAFTGTINGDRLTLNKLESAIPANTAVVLKGTPGTYTFGIQKGIGLPLIENDLKGTLKPIEATGKYVLAKPADKEIGFYLAETGTIAPCKAYLEVNAPEIKAFYFDGDGANAIKNVNVNATVGSSIYNLSGQRVNKAQKGVYVVGGKKVLF